MDISSLGIGGVAVITVICFLVGQLVKATGLDNKYIPVIVGVAGGALGVLGSMPLADLRLAILTGDAAALSRAPGIGKKTAQRISLELKDKLAQDALSGAEGLDDAAFAIEPDAPAQDALGEALLALKSLGYTPQEAAAALKGVKGQAETPDELIKLALRHMAQNM